MIHRVCFGSIERFIGILTEHFAGKFPTWLAPTQVKVLPVSDKSMDYAKEVYEALREKMIRCELDTRNEKIGYKIREARQVDRVPVYADHRREGSGDKHRLRPRPRHRSDRDHEARRVPR